MSDDAREPPVGRAVRIVYYGPGLVGKTTNLWQLADAAGVGGDVTVVETVAATDHCEFLPLVRPGRHQRLHLIAVPGRLQRAADRRRLLRGADGVIFVADGRAARQDANLVLLDELGSHLAAAGVASASFPLVLQYNHRDLPDAVPPEDMDRLLNGRCWPAVPACALTGEGVETTLDTLLERLPFA